MFRVISECKKERKPHDVVLYLEVLLRLLRSN